MCNRRTIACLRLHLICKLWCLTGESFESILVEPSRRCPEHATIATKGDPKSEVINKHGFCAGASASGGKEYGNSKKSLGGGGSEIVRG